MKELPIMFSTRMVQAILSGKKTQTRRIVPRIGSPLKNIAVGDILWVKETYYDGCRLLYKADVTRVSEKVSWKSGMFMKKGYCRIFLRVLDIEFQKLFDISAQAAKREGFEDREGFLRYFCFLNKLGKTENPSVMAISFNRVDRSL